MAKYPNYTAHGNAGGENDYDLYVEVAANNAGVTEAALAAALKTAINTLTGMSNATVTVNSVVLTSL